jgi:CHASE3 domain sensor protein
MLASKIRLPGSGQTGPDPVYFGSRLALLIGFGGLLLIMALAGIDSLRVLRQFRNNDEEIRRLYLFQNHVLNDIRSDVYVSGTYVRDYLLEPDPERAEAYRTKLEDVRRHQRPPEHRHS